MKDKMTLDIRELGHTLQDNDRMWLFISHSDPEKSLFERRWAIAWRKRDNWWGVIALFPATHERAIDDITKEMKLAKEAITILRGGRELKEGGKR